MMCSRTPSSNTSFTFDTGAIPKNPNISHITFYLRTPSDTPDPASIVVNKTVIAADGTSAPAEGWSFTASTGPDSGAEVTGDPAVTTDDGSATFPVTFNDSFTPGTAETVNITETQKTGYTLLPGTVCTAPEGARQPIYADTNNGFTVNVLPGETVTCNVTNQQQSASIVVNKTVIAADGTSAPAEGWSFTASTGPDSGAEVTGDPAVTTDDGSATFPVTFNDSFTPGTAETVNITETQKTGYTLLPGTVCTAPEGARQPIYADTNNGFTVNVLPGETVTCNVTNQQQSASIVVNKTVIAADGTSAPAEGWSFTASTGPDSGAEVTGDPAVTTDDGSATFPVTFNDSFTPGTAETVNITETQKTGYTLLPGTVCTAPEGARQPIYADTNNGFTVNVLPGETVTCNVTNQQQSASIVVNKTVIAADGTSAPAEGWSFTASTGPDSGAEVTGDPAVTTDDGSATFPVTFNDSFTPGTAETVNITETQKTGYTLLPGTVCTAPEGARQPIYADTNNGFTVNVLPGETVTCNVTNQQQSASIVVNKTVIAADGTSAPAEGWSFTASTGPDSGAEVTGDPAVTTDDGSATFPVTFNDSFTPGTAETVNITETQKTGYTLLPGTVCTAPEGARQPIYADTNNGFTVNVLPGETVTCNVTNQQQSASIVVNKTVIAADGTSAPAEGWSFTASTGPDSGAEVTGDPAVTTDDGSATFPVTFNDSFTPGTAETVNITETQKTGYTLLPGTVCTAPEGARQPIYADTNNGFTVNVLPGETVTCNVTNQQQSASIVVNKTVIAADGTSAPAEGWSFTASTGPDSGAEVTGDPAVTTDDGSATFPVTFNDSFTPGTAETVNITETQKTGYTLVQQDQENAICSVVRPDSSGSETLPTDTYGTLGFSIPVYPGDQVSCTVLNQAPSVVPLVGTASIEVTKMVVPFGGSLNQAAPAGGWTFDAESTGGILDSNAGTTVDPSGSVNFRVAFVDPDVPASVTITEQQQDGFTLLQQNQENAVCTVAGTDQTWSSEDAGPLGFAVQVRPSDVVSCVVVNQAVGLLPVIPPVDPTEPPTDPPTTTDPVIQSQVLSSTPALRYVGSGSLAETGNEAWPVAVAIGVLLLLGTGLTLLVRRSKVD